MTREETRAYKYGLKFKSAVDSGQGSIEIPAWIIGDKKYWRMFMRGISDAK